MKGLLQRLVRRLFARSDQASKRAGVISAITLALLASHPPGADRPAPARGGRGVPGGEPATIS